MGRLIGIVSFGDESAVCNADTVQHSTTNHHSPGVYTKISSYISWIVNTTGILRQELTGIPPARNNKIGFQSPPSASCQDYEHQVGNKCVQNKCKCAKGQPATTNCLRHGARKCANCQKDTNFIMINGYCHRRRVCKQTEHLVGNNCIQNKCKCARGNSADKTSSKITV